MKKLAIAVLLSCATVAAQTTPNIGLNLPVYSSPNWNIPLNQNFTILDNYLGGVNSFPNPLNASITGSAANLSGGVLGSVPYQSAAGQTVLLGPNTTISNLFLCEQGTGVVGAAPTWCAGGGSVTSFAAPSASWPSWLVPTVTNSTTAPSLAVAASAIPNSALANVSTTVNGQTCTLGGTCTVTAAAGTLTGATLAAGVTASSLTSVGTITSGVWEGAPIANSYLANNYTTVNGQVCTLGGSCTVTAGTASNLSGGALGSVPYQTAANFTAMLAPNTSTATYYLCETGTGIVGAPPTWCVTGSNTPFASILSGVNTTATMTVGTGSVLTFSGTGAVNATGVNISASSVNAAQYVPFVAGTGVQNMLVSTATTLLFNPLTGTFISGALEDSSLTSGQCVQASTGGLLTSSGAPCGSSGAITVGTTTVGSGTNGYVLYDNNGMLGDLPNSFFIPVFAYTTDGLSAGTAGYTVFSGYSAMTATEASIQAYVPSGCTMANLRVLLNGGDQGSLTTVVTALRKNASSTSLTCTITGNGSTGTGCEDLAHDVSVSAGDLLDWIVTPSASLAITGNVSISSTWNCAL